MFKVNDVVMYRDLEGKVKSVMDNMSIVTLPDGKDYSLPDESLTFVRHGEIVAKEMPTMMAELIPHLKNIAFLNELAKVMAQSGISELHIKAGAIQAFSAKESLAERTARYTAEATAEAARKAKEDHEKESVVA
jgi:hypothetical protein